MLNLFQHLINRVPNQVQDDKYDILFCANYSSEFASAIHNWSVHSVGWYLTWQLFSSSESTIGCQVEKAWENSPVFGQDLNNRHSPAIFLGQVCPAFFKECARSCFVKIVINELSASRLYLLLR